MTARVTTQILTFVLVLCFGSAVQAFQTREHLTPEEVDLVKEAQILDKRIDVFIKAAERRMIVLSGVDPNAKQAKKDSETWGVLPSGSRAELIGDIAKIFDEAIVNIEDVSSRDEKNPLIAKALRKLAATATRIIEQLKPVETKAKDEAELNNFDQLAEYADSIVQAANKLPAQAEKKGKSKPEKSKDTN